MTPVVGITCSTLVLSGMRGVPRFALVHAYVDCVIRAGGLPLLLPNAPPETALPYLDRLDGLVLSGGLDVDPVHYGQEPKPTLGKIDGMRDAFELEITRQAHAADVPILAICRGLQVLNVAFGGTLLQDVRTEVPGAVRHDQDAVRQDALAHAVEIEPNTRLHAVAGVVRARVNSFHHQAADRVADGLVVSARAADGVIEGLEDPSRGFCVSVQWHPERRPDDLLTRALFQTFVDAAREGAEASRQQPAAARRRARLA
jgi:putative glutamine amidotransferase